jgi:hypothetical protein
LQATAWVGDFIRAHLGDDLLKEAGPIDLLGVEPSGTAALAVEALFEELPARTYDLSSKTPGGYRLVDRQARVDVGRKAFALVHGEPAAAGLYMQAALNCLCSKAAVEAHEFKLPAALFENFEWVSSEWRPRLLAASAHWLHGRQSSDSDVMQQARQELRKVGVV